MKKIFITGANGFVGKPLCDELQKRGKNVVAGVRQAQRANEISYGDFSEQNNWLDILENIEVVIHLAARVHVMNEKDTDPLAAFMKMNCEATIKMAKSAKAAGVKRFIFISSIKVNGERTLAAPFSADDTPAPEDAYGISKAEAEKKLMELHETGKFEVVILRPPLIYGPGVKANFKNLMYLVERDLPIPFGRIDFNKRSLVSVYNLIDLIILCIDHPQAGGNIFLVSDDDDLSLKELILLMGKVLNKTPHLLPVPITIIRLGLTMIGKKSYGERLFGNLQLDIEKTKKNLNWSPKYSFLDSYNKNKKM